MTGPSDPMDRALKAWLEEGPSRGREEGLQATLAETRRASQRPAWLLPQRWLPVDTWRWEGLDPRAIAIALVLAGLVLLALITALVVGSHRRLPLPFGPAANGTIAYDTGRGGGIYLANPDGTSPRRLVGGDGIERSPVFSPDGTRLAFWSRPPDDPSRSPDPCACTTFHLYVADADGTGAHVLGRDQSFAVDPGSVPSWSPDSTRLVFAAPDNGLDQLWVVAADGSGPARKIPGGGASRTAPAWSPDGRLIAFAELRPGEPPRHAVVVVRPDRNDEQVLHQQIGLGDPDGEAAFAGEIAWSPDGMRLTYGRGQDPGRPDEQRFWAYLEVVDLQGVERQAAVERSGWLRSLAWSPDGGSIAFVSGELSTKVEIVHLDGAPPMTVVYCSGQIEGHLPWSPDGRWLASGCPDWPRLVSATGSGATLPIPLPSGAAAIDIQRLAP